MLPPGLLLMTSGPFGVSNAEAGLFRAYVLLLEALLLLAALPFLVEVCYVFVAGVWEAELLVVRARAGFFVLAKVMRLISTVLNSSSTLLFLLCYSFVRISSLLRMF